MSSSSAAARFDAAPTPARPFIRAAQVTDYGECVALFTELDGAPVLNRVTWQREMMPTSLVVQADARVVAHAFVQPLDDTLFLSHVVVTHPARRSGLGRALLSTLATIGRRAGFARWALNVDANNAPAVRLYESLGFQYAYDSVLLEIDWRAALAQPRARTLLSRTILPTDDAKVGFALGILPGIFAVARARPDSVMLLVEDEAQQVVAAAVFGPDGFPGAHPFRVAQRALPACAFSLLAALAPYAKRPTVTVVVEGNPAVAAALVQAGAVEKVRMSHYRGNI